MFDDCWWGTYFWSKNVGCEQDVDGIAGNDVITQELYYDNMCTEKIQPGDYVEAFFSKKYNAEMEMTYAETISEGNAYRTYRRKDTKAKYYEMIAFDIVCDKQGSTKDKDKDKKASSPVIQYAPQNYRDLSVIDWMDNDKPKHPVYNEPQYPVYNAPAYETSWYAYLAVNVLVSMVCALCVIGVCLLAYNCMQNKSVYSAVKWAKEQECDV